MAMEKSGICAMKAAQTGVHAFRGRNGSEGQGKCHIRLRK